MTAIILLGCLSSLAVAQPDFERPHSQTSAIIKFRVEVRSDSPEVMAFLMVAECRLSHWCDMVPGMAIVEFEAGRVEHVVEWAQRWPEVEYGQPDYSDLRLAASPNDLWFPEQWGLHNTGQTVNGVTGTAGADIRGLNAWTITTDGSKVIVAVLDTGRNYLHAEFSGNGWKNPNDTYDGLDNDSNGYVDDVFGIGVDYVPPNPSTDCISACSPGACQPEYVLPDNDPYDVNGPVPRVQSASDPAGHGSTVAAIIGAVGNNNTAGTGVAWAGRVMSIRVVNHCRCLLESSLIKAMDYAWKNDAKILNTSIEWNQYDAAAADAFLAASDRRMLIVAAAGNGYRNIDSPGASSYPASFALANQISVAASNQSDGRPAFSNWGYLSVHLAAPGVNIIGLAASEDGPTCRTRYWDGTSFAAPHVAGAAALVWSQHPSWTAAQVKARILCGVRPVSAWSGLTVTGGILDLSRVVAPACP